MKQEAERSSAAADTFSVFSRAEAAVAEALALTFFPRQNPIGISGIEAQVPRYLDNYLLQFSFFFRLGFSIILRVLNWAPVVLLNSCRTLKRMPEDDRERFLTRWRGSGWYLVRLGFHGLKLLFSTAYFNHPEVLQRIGYYEVCPPEQDRK